MNIIINLYSLTQLTFNRFLLYLSLRQFSTMARWNESQLRKYNIKLEKIPILQYDDPKVDYLLSSNVSFSRVLYFKNLLLLNCTRSLALFLYSTQHLLKMKQNWQNFELFTVVNFLLIFILLLFFILIKIVLSILFKLLIVFKEAYWNAWLLIMLGKTQIVMLYFDSFKN